MAEILELTAFIAVKLPATVLTFAMSPPTVLTFVIAPATEPIVFVPEISAATVLMF